MYSETKPHSETPLPRLVGSSRRRDKTKIGVVYIGLRVRKVRVVRRIQCFRTKLEFDALRDREGAVETKVRFKEPRPSQAVSTSRSESLRLPIWNVYFR